MTFTFRGQSGQLFFYQDNILAARAQFGPFGTSSTGTGNTSFGVNAGAALTLATNAYNNTFVGANAGASTSSGYQNTFVASSAGSSNTTGFTNTGIGQGALFNNETGSANTAIGWHAALNLEGAGSVTAVGARAAQGANGSTAAYITAVGEGSLLVVSSAQETTAVGRSSGAAVTTASNAVLLGDAAGISLTTGNNNTFVGYRSGYTATPANATTTGTDNVFIGYRAGSGTSSQISNAIAIGADATVAASNAATYGNSNITATTIYGAVTLPTGTVTSGAGTNLTISAPSGPSLALGQGATGGFTFTQAGNGSQANTKWNSGGAIGVAQDFTRTTASAVAGDVIAYDNAFNGANRVGIAGYESDGATDSGRYTVWTKATGASIAERLRITSGGAHISSIPEAAPALTSNATMTWELTSNTSITLKVRGNDGVTRSVSFTVAP